MSSVEPRARLAVLGGTMALAIAVLVVALSSGGSSVPPISGTRVPAAIGDPFSYRPGHDAELMARASAGSAHVLFAKSPGGVPASAARVAQFRTQIDAVTAGTGVDPRQLEAIVLLESAGRAQAVAGSDASAAAGLTQILAQTGQSLLGMHIDLARSRQLSRAIVRAAALGQERQVAQLERQRAKIDDRFDPRKALAATVRYLSLARRRFGRADLAIVSYHMGIGNLQNVLRDYGGGGSVSYAQLYFDTALDRHVAAFNRLHSFGDDSSLYFWRVLGAVEIMRLFRSDRAALGRLASLQQARNSSEEVLHPQALTPTFAGPDALRTAYSQRTLLPLPANPAALGLAYDAGIGSLARRLGAQASLYRGLRPAALKLLLALAARVHALSAGQLTVTSVVRDTSYQRLLGVHDPEATHGYSLHTTGFAFDIARRYPAPTEATAFQATLERLQALDLIAWVREPTAIHVTVASDAGSLTTNLAAPQSRGVAGP